MPNGSGTAVSGLFRFSVSSALFGTFSGTLRNPSMSSEKATRRVGMLSLVSVRKAWRTIEVRATSPKVPICGRPEGP